MPLVYETVIPPAVEVTAWTWYRFVAMLRTMIVSPSADAPVANVRVEPVATMTEVTSLTIVPTKVAADPATVIVTLLAPAAVNEKT